MFINKALTDKGIQSRNNINKKFRGIFYNLTAHSNIQIFSSQILKIMCITMRLLLWSLMLLLLLLLLYYVINKHCEKT